MYFKTLGGMLAHKFEELGEVDSNGHPIKSIEQPISRRELETHLRNKIQNAVNKMRTKGENRK